MADSGHYYSYVFDHKEEVWWKFNDNNVQMESEDVIMEESIGG